MEAGVSSKPLPVYSAYELPTVHDPTESYLSSASDVHYHHYMSNFAPEVPHHAPSHIVCVCVYV